MHAQEDMESNDACRMDSATMGVSYLRGLVRRGSGRAAPIASSACPYMNGHHSSSPLLLCWLHLLRWPDCICSMEAILEAASFCREVPLPVAAVLLAYLHDKDDFSHLVLHRLPRDLIHLSLAIAQFTCRHTAVLLQLFGFATGCCTFEIWGDLSQLLGFKAWFQCAQGSPAC